MVYLAAVARGGNATYSLNRLNAHGIHGFPIRRQDPGADARRNPSSLLVPPMSEVPSILSAIEQGDPHAAEQLLPLVYEELRKLAAQKLASEKPGQTLQATALVHEAYLRIVGSEQVQPWD